MEKLETKIKKMSLANIQGRLTIEEMENVMAGSGASIDCVAAGTGLILGALTIGAVTGGIGLAIWGAGMGLNVFGMARSC